MPKLRDDYKLHRPLQHYKYTSFDYGQVPDDREDLWLNAATTLTVCAR